MSALKDTNKIAHHGLTVLSRLIENDTEVATVDLNLLENLNTNQSLNYIKLEEKLDSLDKNAGILQDLNKEFEQYKELIDVIDAKSLQLEAIVTELEQWSKEISDQKN